MEVVQYVKQSQRTIINLLLPQHRARLHALPQRSAFYELLHYIQRGGRAPPLEEVKDFRNPAVIELREHLCLPLE